MKKSYKKNYLLITAFILIFGACYDPIFYTISQEVEPIDPRINGGPTNIVIFNGEMYVASLRNLWKYSGNKIWESRRPGGNFSRLASATDNYLYALVYEETSTKSLKRSITGDDWEDINADTGDFNSIQYIYAAGNKLFIGAANADLYAVFYIEHDAAVPEITPLAIGSDPEVSYEICGAASVGTNYFICTKGQGIHLTDFSAGATLINGSSDIDFAGMINIGAGKIVAISRNGELYSVTSATVEPISGVSISGRAATGALGIWTDPNSPEDMLLLAGRKESLEYSTSSGYTYGYVELELDLLEQNGIKSGTQFREPGEYHLSSILDGDNERFKSTIGKHPVNHLMQAPDGILFASTQKNGVWSYREDRNGGPQWNAEE